MRSDIGRRTEVEQWARAADRVATDALFRVPARERWTTDAPRTGDDGAKRRPAIKPATHGVSAGGEEELEPDQPLASDTDEADDTDPLRVGPRRVKGPAFRAREGPVNGGGGPRLHQRRLRSAQGMRRAATRTPSGARDRELRQQHEAGP